MTREQDILGQAAAENRRQADIARVALRSSVKAIDDALVQLGRDQFSSLPGLQAINLALLDRAAAGCDALLELAPSDPAVLAEVGRVQLHMAEAAAEADGRGEREAIRHLERALAFQARRAAASPEDLEANIDRSYTQSLLGVRLSRTGTQQDKARARDALDAALAQQRQLVGDPRVQADVGLKARCLCHLGRTLVAFAQWRSSNDPDKRVVFETMNAALDRLQAAYELDPSRAEYAHRLGAALVISGVLARGFREQKLARSSLATARRLLEATPVDVRREPRIQRQLANAYNIAHLVEADDRRMDVARAYLDRAIEIRTRLVQENPVSLGYKGDLASAYTSLGSHERFAGRLQQAAAAYEAAFRLAEEVTRVNPDVLAYRKVRGDAGFLLGEVLLADKRWVDAGRAFENVRPYLVSASDFARAGAGFARCAGGIRGENAALTGQVEHDWRRNADAAITALRTAKELGDTRTGAELTKLVPIGALRGATGYGELLKEWGLEDATVGRACPVDNWPCAGRLLEQLNQRMLWPKLRDCRGFPTRPDV